MLAKKQVGQTFLRCEVFLFLFSIQKLYMRATYQFLDEEEFDQPVFFSSIRFPERKIKHMEWEYLFTTV